MGRHAWGMDPGRYCRSGKIMLRENTTLFDNMFIAEESVSSEPFRYGQRDINQFIRGGRLNMDLVLRKFVEYFTDIYGENDEKFVEAYGRKFFLLYLKPIINGTGNYYLDKGYLLSFNLNKKKTPGVTEVKISDKTIVEALV